MELLDNSARKTGDGYRLALECEKTRSAHYIGERTGLFRVPRVLRLDQQQGILETERIYQLESLGRHLISEKIENNILRKVGFALSCIHREMRLSEYWCIPMPEKLMGKASDKVILHGDFSLGNVCVDKKKNFLVIIDWSSAPFIEQTFSLGSKYFDITWFSFCLFCAAPISILPRWPANKMTERFLTGYRDGASVDLEAYNEYAMSLGHVFKRMQLQRVQQSKNWKRPFHYLRMAWSWHSWMRFLRGNKNA